MDSSEIIKNIKQEPETNYVTVLFPEDTEPSPTTAKINHQTKPKDPQKNQTNFRAVRTYTKNLTPQIDRQTNTRNYVVASKKFGKRWHSKGKFRDEERCFAVRQNKCFEQQGNALESTSSAADSVLLTNSPESYEYEFVDETLIEIDSSSESSLQPSTSSGHNSSLLSEVAPRQGRPKKSQHERAIELSVCADKKKLKKIRNNLASSNYRDMRTSRRKGLEMQVKELEKNQKALKREYKSGKQEIREWKRILKFHAEIEKESHGATVVC